MLLHRALLSIPALFLAFLATAAPQTGGPPRYLREDRSASPPLMPWQRNLDDALALSRATGKPLLICVNMDGEMASEALAADRYRDPEFVALANGFIPLLASPDRHDALDHTSRGVRIPDSKLGRVTNSEHIEIEPELYELWFDGRRVAPRHVGVSPSGEVLFDLYLLTDLSKIDEALAEFGKFPEPPIEAEPEVTDEGDSEEAATEGESAASEPLVIETQPIIDDATLLASPDAADRDLLEARFVAAEVEDRVRLTELAFAHDRETQHPELLRLALLDPDRTVRSAGLAEITAHPASASFDHYVLAARVAADATSTERDAFLTALDEAAANEPDPANQSSAQLAVALRAIAAGSTVIDAAAWTLGTAELVSIEPDPSIEWDERLARIEAQLREHPDDADWNVLFARNGRAYALSLMASGGNPDLILEDVRRAAERALVVRPNDGPANALAAWSCYMQSDFDAAVNAARLGLPALQAWSQAPLAVETVEILADSCTRRLYRQIEAREVPDGELLADAVVAYEVLRAHPLGTEARALRGIQLLGSFNLFADQHRAVAESLERWPQSGAMHEWYRWVVVRDEGSDGLLTAYDDRALVGLAPAQRLSFSGLAKLQAAERRIAERDPARALEDYRAAFQDLESAVGESASVGTFARWYQAQARAGRARLLLDADRLSEALAEILLCFSFETAAHDEPDAFGVKPRETLRSVHAALIEAGRASDAQTLERFLDPPSAATSDEADSESGSDS